MTKITSGVIDVQLGTVRVNAAIAVDIKRNGTKSAFVRVKPGVFGLRELHAAETTSAVGAGADAVPDNAEEGSPPKDETEQRVRTPLFPRYREVRHLLRVWPGRPRKQVTGLQTTLGELWGTPQNTVRLDRPRHMDPRKAFRRRTRARRHHLDHQRQDRQPAAHLWPLAPESEIRSR